MLDVAQSDPYVSYSCEGDGREYERVMLDVAQPDPYVSYSCEGTGASMSVSCLMLHILNHA